MADKREDPPTFMSSTFPDVTPLQQNKQDNKTPGRKKPLPVKRPTGGDYEIPSLRLSGDSTIGANDELNYQGNGLQNRIMRDLKRGKIPIENELDLHGQTVEQAHQSCMEFIHHCLQNRQYCVSIIHGQGYRSTGGVPVLKQQVSFWLRQHAGVLAFCSAQQRDGGKGAVYILLRKK